MLKNNALIVFILVSVFSFSDKYELPISLKFLSDSTTQIPSGVWKDTILNSSHYAVHRNTGTAGTSDPSYLYAKLPQFNTDDTLSWSVSVKHAYNPSSSNNWNIIIWSDGSDYNSSTSYRIGTGFGSSPSSDTVRIYKHSSATDSLIFTTKLSYKTLIGTSIFANFVISKSKSNVWSIYYSKDGNDTLKKIANFNLKINNLENPFIGAKFSYSLTTKSDKFYFGKCSFYGNKIPIVIDSIKPRLIAFENRINNVILKFSEKIQKPAISSFSVTNNSIDSIKYSKDSIIIYLKENMQSGNTYKLRISNILDLSNNSIKDTSINLTFYDALKYNVIINEYLCKPEDTVGLPKYKFIEIKNTSNFDINLKNWKILVGSSKSVFPDINISKNDFLILTESKGVEAYKKYGNTIGMSCVSSLTSTTSKEVILLNKKDSLIDYISAYNNYINEDYKRNGGWSIEKLNSNNPCFVDFLWKASINEKGGTPGKENSLTSMVLDTISPQIKRLSILKDTLVFETSEPINIEAGLQEFILSESNVSPTFIKANMQKTLFKCVFSDTFLFRTQYNLHISNKITDCVNKHIIENSLNTFGKPEVPLENDLLINEILYDPLPNRYRYLEFYNNTSKFFDLSKLKVSSKRILNNDFDLTDISEGLFFPNSYLVVTEDASMLKNLYNIKTNNVYTCNLPAFNSDADTVYLLYKKQSNLPSFVVDSLAYSKDFQSSLLSNTEGVALERRYFDKPTCSKGNWSSASESSGFGTPAKVNSNQTIENSEDQKDGIFFKNRLFSPNSDGFNDILEISFSKDLDNKAVTIKIYDDKGYQIRTLTNTEFLTSGSMVVWDGANDEGQKVKTGIYILIFEIFDENGLWKKIRKTCVVK